MSKYDDIVIHGILGIPKPPDPEYAPIHQELVLHQQERDAVLKYMQLLNAPARYCWKFYYGLKRFNKKHSELS